MPELYVTHRAFRALCGTEVALFCYYFWVGRRCMIQIVQHAAFVVQSSDHFLSETGEVYYLLRTGRQNVRHKTPTRTQMVSDYDELYVQDESVYR